MKKQLIFCTMFILCLVMSESCTSSSNSNEQGRFEISKYKGYKILDKMEEGFADTDLYILKSDTIAIELEVPNWFGNIYNIGDTIK